MTTGADQREGFIDRNRGPLLLAVLGVLLVAWGAYATSSTGAGGLVLLLGGLLLVAAVVLAAVRLGRPGR